MVYELTDKKVTQGQADKLSAPMELDLWAIFKIMEEDALKLSERYKGTPEEFINEIIDSLNNPAEQLNRISKSLICNINKNRKLQGRIKFQGLDISIENRKGSVRRGADIDKYKNRIEKSYGIKKPGVDMPKPKAEENEQAFITRCVPIVMKEGSTKEQALGKCYGIYRNVKKAIIKKDLVVESLKLLTVWAKAALPAGTKRERKDGIYEKLPNGKWKKISQKEKGKKDKEISKEEQKEINKNIRKKVGLPKVTETGMQKLMEKGKRGGNLWTEYGLVAHEHLVGAAWLAGEKGTPMPFMNVGWRWGKADGASYNFQENKKEAGISTAKMKGFKKISSFAADPQGRKKHFYIGYTITHDTGGDDELLFVPEGRYAAKEISEEDYNNFEPDIPDLGGWWYKGRLIDGE